ncbi:MAG: hypothetical protein KF761_14845 [Salinibacterium sp.]|nr:hypothetical protein [Salinibacterium sp.]
MRRELIPLLVVAAVVVAVFGGAVFVLNATLYSASGFVRSYLDSIARHDVDGALELAGTLAVGDASDELLTPDALGTLSNLRLVSDDTDAQGIHRIVYAFTTGDKSGESTFSVRPQGSLLGLFSTWGFDTNPLGVLQVLPQHGSTFSVNGVKVIAPAAGTPAPYLVFAPMSYELTEKSRFLEAPPVTVTASQPGAAIIATVNLRPTAELVDQVQSEINKYLDTCATQVVLLPTGCPFGEEISNRIVSTPQWSIAQYPRVTLAAGPDPGTWLIPRTDAAAHLVVEVKSLFDGSVSTFDEDVRFSSSYVVTILPDGQLLIKGI